MPREVKVGTELQNRYVVSQLLGDGGFGIVWHATDKHVGRDVAIKRMKTLGGGELESLRFDFWERKLITEALRRTDGNIPEAAKLLAIGRATLYRKIEEYGIQR